MHLSLFKKREGLKQHNAIAHSQKKLKSRDDKVSCGREERRCSKALQDSRSNARVKKRTFDTHTATRDRGQRPNNSRSIKHTLAARGLKWRPAASEVHEGEVTLCQLMAEQHLVATSTRTRGCQESFNSNAQVTVHLSLSLSLLHFARRAIKSPQRQNALCTRPVSTLPARD